MNLVKCTILYCLLITKTAFERLPFHQSHNKVVSKYIESNKVHDLNSTVIFILELNKVYD